MTPYVASIMELRKGSLASLEKRLLGKKDPHHAGSARVLPAPTRTLCGRSPCFCANDPGNSRWHE